MCSQEQHPSSRAAGLPKKRRTLCWVQLHAMLTGRRQESRRSLKIAAATLLEQQERDITLEVAGITAGDDVSGSQQPPLAADAPRQRSRQLAYH
jgi:hypothetical protein